MSAIRLARAVDRPRAAPEVRRRLPRPRRRPARPGRLRPRDAGDPGEPRRPRERGRRDRDRPLERRRRRSAQATDDARVRGDHGRADRRPTWGSSRPRPASSRCCASARPRNGALLIFDEVITGFRVARGGAQELLGVAPDLTIMGKIVGGGLPAAAYGGPRALMERIAPAGDVYQAGTLSGNPLAVAAARATLAHLDAGGLRPARGRHRAAGRRPARRRGERGARPARAVGPRSADPVLHAPTR